MRGRGTESECETKKEKVEQTVRERIIRREEGREW